MHLHGLKQEERFGLRFCRLNIKEKRMTKRFQLKETNK